MKILYISDRINAPDGSSVHGRSFVDSIRKLGHEIMTFPEIRPIDYQSTMPKRKVKKDLIHYLKKVNFRTLNWMLHQSNGYVSEVLSMLEGWVSTYRHYHQLKLILESFPADLIIYRYRLFNMAPYWAAKTYGIPVMSEINSLKSTEKLLGKGQAITALTISYERRMIRKSDYLFTVSDAIKETIKQYCPQKQIVIIPNGVDTEKFNPEKYNQDEVKESIGLKGKIIIGYAGSYKTWHGLNISIDTIEKLVEIDPGYHLVLIGGGGCFTQIKEQIKKRRLDEAVTQIENTHHDQMPYYLSAFDFAIMSYPVIDNFYFSPLKMFEYMAMGIPVVATDIGQIGEIIIHGRTGLLVRYPKADLFVETICNAKELIPEIQANARQLMIEQYSWKSNAERVLGCVVPHNSISGLSGRQARGD